MRQATIEQFLLYRYRYLIGYTLLVLLAVGSLFLGLAKLTPSISNPEAASAVDLDLHNIMENPVYAPYKILQWLSVHVLLGGTALAARIPSVLFGAATVTLFYLLLRAWHRPRVAILGGLLLVTASWFLHIARLGIPDVSLTFGVVFLLLGATLFHHHQNRWTLLLLLSAMGFCLYMPFGIYLIGFTLAAISGDMLSYRRGLNWTRFLLAIIFGLVVAAPLIWAIAQNIHILRNIMGIPLVWPEVLIWLKNFATVFGFIFWRAPVDPVLHLSTLPMLDFFTATMTAIGLYHYEQHWELRRTRLIIGWFFMLMVVVSLASRQSQFAILIPLIYIFAATGVVTLLFQWYEIFPRNPIARIVALAPLGLVLALTIGYHLNRYFIAWPFAPETKLAFSSEPRLLRDWLNRHSRQQDVLIIAPLGEITRDRYAVIKLNDVSSTTIDSVHGVTADNLTVYDQILVQSGVELPQELAAQLQRQPELIVNERTANNIAFYVFKPVHPLSETP